LILSIALLPTLPLSLLSSSPVSPRPAEGSWEERKRQAVKAYHEWMPTRVLGSDTGAGFYRSFQFGDLATLLMMESRVTVGALS